MREGGALMSRRRVLAWLSGLLGSVTTLLMGVPLVTYAVSPALEKRSARWVKTVPVTELKPGQMNAVRYRFQTKDAWLDVIEERIAYAHSPDGERWTVLSAACTHLGCNVNWDPDRHEFRCPCHTAVYAADGAVRAGPPPRPLRHLNARVEDGTLMVEEG